MRRVWSWLICGMVVIGGLAVASGTAAAAGTATAGVVGVNGLPTLVISGTNRADRIRATSGTAVPPWDDRSGGRRISIVGISDPHGGMSPPPDGSLPRTCWREADKVYCLSDGLDGVRADLGAGRDSLVALGDLPVVADGGPGRDTIRGGSGDDVLRGGPGPDRLYGMAGDDILRGDAGDDFLIGDIWRSPTARRSFSAPAGRDRIYGGSGDDTIQGGAGADRLFGGPGDDNFQNNRDGAPDLIQGGAGLDALDGNSDFERKARRPGGPRY